MAEITSEPVTDKASWEAFMEKHPEANFLQSWYWGVFHENIGHKISRTGFYSGGQLIGITLAVVEPARRGRHLVIAGGPIIDWENRQLVSCWLKTIKQIAKEHGCVFVRVRPQLLDIEQNRLLFKQLGFRKAPMHVTADLTTQLDLSKTDDELKHAMRKGTRYELNRTHKFHISVEATFDDTYLQEFYKLQLETATRQKFVPFSERFLTEQFKAFNDAGKVILYRSTFDGKLLAMAFVIFYGSEAAYHYGASTDLARQYPGAYAIQWEAIHEAQRRGCARYNFWGVTEHGKTKHRFYGVSVFKRGFGGDDVAYLPARDLVISALRYPATFAFETARRKLRRL